MTLNLSDWFTQQLQSNADGFQWAVMQAPEDRRMLQPPPGLGEWNATRHVFHVLFYERTLAIPSMQQWLGGPLPEAEDDAEEAAWAGNPLPVKLLLAQFLDLRARQITLLGGFSEMDWNRERDTVWGPVTLLWVVSKTYQHTAEHISDVLRIALFWDIFAARHNPI